jgi:hypothetical protein
MCTVREKVETDSERESEREREREREREWEIGRGATESVLDIGLNKLLQTSRRSETSNSPHIT